MKRVGAGEQDFRHVVTDVRPKMRGDQIKENAFPNGQWVFVLADVNSSTVPGERYRVLLGNAVNGE